MLKPTPEPAISFRVPAHEQPVLEVRVNFGVFAGRHATPAEIDDLARTLHVWMPSFSIVAEERHEFGSTVEASVHQVVIEVSAGQAGDDPDALGARIVSAAEAWAQECIASRHGGGDL